MTNTLVGNGLTRLKSLKNVAAPLLGVLLLAASGLANAMPIEFKIDSVDVQILNESGFCIGGGCTPEVNSSVPITFELSTVGEETDPFDLFSVDIGGFLAIGGGSADVVTTISFSSPSNGSTSSPGTGIGTFNSSLDLSTWWNPQNVQTASIAFTTDPGNVVFNDGTEVSIALNSAFGSCSIGVFNNNCPINVGVTATSTLQAIPEPGTVALFGAGMLGLGFVGWRRKSI